MPSVTPCLSMESTILPRSWAKSTKPLPMPNALSRGWRFERPKSTIQTLCQPTRPRPIWSIFWFVSRPNRPKSLLIVTICQNCFINIARLDLHVPLSKTATSWPRRAVTFGTRSTSVNWTIASVASPNSIQPTTRPTRLVPSTKLLFHFFFNVFFVVVSTLLLQGFSDHDYRKRRNTIAQIAENYRQSVMISFIYFFVFQFGFFSAVNQSLWLNFPKLNRKRGLPFFLPSKNSTRAMLVPNMSNHWNDWKKLAFTNR